MWIKGSGRRAQKSAGSVAGSCSPNEEGDSPRYITGWADPGNKNGARRRRFSFPSLQRRGEPAAGLFVFQVGVALQTQLQLVEQGLAGRVVQRRVGDDPLVVLADN